MEMREKKLWNSRRRRGYEVERVWRMKGESANAETRRTIRIERGRREGKRGDSLLTASFDCDSKLVASVVQNKKLGLLSNACRTQMDGADHQGMYLI